MRYKQEQKGSPYYYREGDHWCETLTTWLEKDPEGEFIGKDGDNPTSPPYKNTISLNTSGAGRNQAQNGTTSGQFRDKMRAKNGDFTPRSLMSLCRKLMGEWTKERLPKPSD